MCVAVACDAVSAYGAARPLALGATSNVQDRTSGAHPHALLLLPACARVRLMSTSQVRRASISLFDARTFGSELNEGCEEEGAGTSAAQARSVSVALPDAIRFDSGQARGDKFSPHSSPGEKHTESGHELSSCRQL